MAKISINLSDGSVSKEHTKPLIVGIDLGTTNSLMAYIVDGLPVTIDYNNGNNVLVPSIIHFTSDGTIIVGEEAKQHLITDPAYTIYSVKRLLGRSFGDLSALQGHLGYQVIDEDDEKLVKIKVGEKFYSPIELSAEILKELKKLGEAKLGVPISQVVITVPAYFNDSQRQATRDAGKLAGLDVLRIINEPTAASLAYDIGTSRDKNEKVVVYDLGGGTFDISILDIQDGVFEVLATNGDTFLGGDDFDKAIIDYWLVTNKITSDRLEADKSFGQAIRILAEKAKKHLSQYDLFTEQNQYGEFSLSLAKFEKLITPLVDKTIALSASCLKESGLAKEDINQVIMVGGSTRTTLVKQKVAAFFEQDVNDDIDPDRVVAMGAAVQGDILAGNRKDMLLLDITPLSLGIETIGGLMDVIVPRNTKVPAGAARQYTTSVDGQTNLRVSVYQGERDLVEDNRKLGEFILSNIPPMPAGIPKIEIRFLIDADGILRVKAKELRSETETEVEIRSQYGLSEEEMGLMLKKSLDNAKVDREKRALIEAKTEANNVILHSHKFLDQNAELLTVKEKELLNEHLSMLKASLDTMDKHLIEERMHVYNDITRPIAERIMDINIADALKDKTV